MKTNQRLSREIDNLEHLKQIIGSIKDWNELTKKAIKYSEQRVNYREKN
jgi:hypothetical protein